MLPKANQSVIGKSHPIGRFIFRKDRGSWQAQNLPAWDSNFSRALLYPRVIKTDSFPTRQHSVSLLSRHLKTQTPSAKGGKRKGIRKIHFEHCQKVYQCHSYISLLFSRLPISFFLNTISLGIYGNMRIRDKKDGSNYGRYKFFAGGWTQLKTDSYWLLPLCSGLYYPHSCIPQIILYLLMLSQESPGNVTVGDFWAPTVSAKDITKISIVKYSHCQCL